MPTSEIDDIFSAKGKAKAVESLPPPPLDVKKEKKNQKKRKDKHASEKINKIGPSSQLKKRPPPETVVDPSSTTSSSKRPKLDASAPSRLIKPSNDNHNEDEARFKNSRGTGPRRKTDDGYNIYKEDELHISNTGGETPLCPFDCNCCF